MKIPSFKQDYPVPNILSREQVLSLIKEIKDPMYKMIAILMYSAGLRVSEAVRLRVSDVRRSNLQLYIHNSKCGKSRYAILSKNALACLEKYYRMYKPKNYFFESPALQDFHIAVENVQKHIKLVAMKIGVECTPHTLRHCFATHLLESGANILYTQWNGERFINCAERIGSNCQFIRRFFCFICIISYSFHVLGTQNLEGVRIHSKCINRHQN